MAAGATSTEKFSWQTPAGRYEVFARWQSKPNRAIDATYEIVDTSGMSMVSVNQRQNGGTWVSLGTHTFAAAGLNISLKPSTTGKVVADALRLVSISAVHTPPHPTHP